LTLAFQPALEKEKTMTTIKGNDDNNTLNGTEKDECIFGYGGFDTLRGRSGNDTLKGGEGEDSLYGGSGHDKLYGQTGADLLDGGGGHDTLYAGDGDDGINGADGRDVIYGGFGSDLMFGGAGADRFVYEKTQDAPLETFGGDQVADFEDIDIIDLHTIDANESANGNQAFQFIGTEAFSEAGQIRTYSDDVNGWTIIEGSTDTDFLSEFRIIINNHFQITAADFLL
jgi:serralysin